MYNRSVAETDKSKCGDIVQYVSLHPEQRLTPSETVEKTLTTEAGLYDIVHAHNVRKHFNNRMMDLRLAEYPS